MGNKYIWGEIQESADTDTHFVRELKCPALIGEVMGRDINGNVSVNLKTRFPYLLDPTKKNEDDKSITMHDWELDLFLHLAAHLDLLSGFNKNNENIDMVRTEIEEGLYGNEVYCLFKKLKCEDQDILLRNFCNSKNGLTAALKNAFKELFPDGLIYRKGDELYFYVDKEQNDDDDIKFSFLKKMFTPIHMKFNVHYKYHMGIIGVQETMKIGKMRIV